MTEQTKPALHPMASSMFAFVNEALTLEELKARLALMEGVVKNIHKELEELEAPAPEAEEPDVGALPVVEADEIILSPEEIRQQKIAEYAKSLEMETVEL